MEEVTERGLAVHEAAGGQLLQPCRPTWKAQVRWRDVQLKTNRQTHPSDGWHQHPATEGITWRHPNASPETSLDGGTERYLRCWSTEQFKWQEGKTSPALWLRNVYLDRLDCFTSNPQSNAAPGAGDGEMALHPLQGCWAC